MKTPFRAILAVIALITPLGALGAAFGVTPIRVDLDPAARTAVINVSNDDKRRLHFQVKLARWTQDPATGEDKYEDSSDLVYFPQSLSIEPNQRRIVRVGLKGPPPGEERAYRIFIEEQPDPEDKGASGGAQVAVRLRFGVPVFASGGKGEARPEIVKVETKRGQARIGVRNNGERSIRFEQLSLVAGERTLSQANGWYVFPGATRWFTIAIADSACPVPEPLEVRAKGGDKDLRRPLEGAKVLCGS